MGKYQTIYGLHSVRAALLNKKRINDELIVTENHKILGKKYQYKIKKIKILKPQDFKKNYGGENTTQGIVLKTQELERPSIVDFVKKEEIEKKSVILVLDQITDPQNIGAIMRSCALFNCRGIIVSKDNAPDLTPSLLKAASGAAEIVNYFKVTNIKRCLSELKKFGYWIYGFDSSKYANSNLSYAKKSVLVFGSEGKGIRELVKKHCDEILKLNTKSNLEFQIDSLNVSNATAIALYEFYNKEI